MALSSFSKVSCSLCTILLDYRHLWFLYLGETLNEDKTVQMDLRISKHLDLSLHKDVLRPKVCLRWFKSGTKLSQFCIYWLVWFSLHRKKIQ